MSIFAPPQLFSTMAVAVQLDDDLDRGTHVRVIPSPALGFPLAPIGIYRLQAERTVPTVVWSDPKGILHANGNLDAAGGVLFADIAVPVDDLPENQSQDVAVEVDGNFDGVAILLDSTRSDGVGREYSRVSKAPYVLGAPRVNRLRLEGRGTARLITWRMSTVRALEQILDSDPLDILSLPIDGRHAWYSGGLGAIRAMSYVKRGAPLRLTPADRPDGPLDLISADNEVQRIQPLGKDVVDACEKMMRDPATWPRDVRIDADALPSGQVAQHSVDMGVPSLLLMQAMDPGLARFLGLMTRVEDLPQAGEPVAYATVAMYAVQRTFGVLRRNDSLYDNLGQQTALMQSAVARNVERIEERTGRRGEFTRLSRSIVNRPVAAIRGVIALCGVVPPPDRPIIAAPLVPAERARWIGRPTLPSNAFRQNMLWATTPLGGLVALGRLEGGTWQSRHRPAPLADGVDSPPRVLPLLLGRTADRPPAMAQSLLSDSPIPSEPDQPPTASRYRVALADLFGRFGPLVEFAVNPPPRPMPLAPMPQASVVLDGPTGVEAGAISPGHVDITVPVPNVADMRAGALPLARLHLVFGAESAHVDLVPEVLADPSARRSVPVVTKRFLLPPTEVAQSGSGVLQATFEDTMGALSDAVSVNIAFIDRRPHPVIPSGLGLIWTSRPGPAEEVELKLKWQAAANASYRVFIADAIGLGLPAGPRANQAVEAGVRARNGTLGARERFRLLSEVKESGGVAVVDERLPRSLGSVQVLRIVPLTANGHEAPFDACPVVPVAVPSERRPPAARIAASIDNATGMATLRIEADGFDWIALQAAEPGLFTDPPAADARHPEFRLRRAIGTVPEPIYAREIARGKLKIERTGDGFRAFADVVDTKPLQPFVRCAWWVEVRLGPERRVREGFEEVPPAGSVEPMSESQRQDLPQTFSLSSPPASAIRMLPLASAPEAAIVTIFEAAGTRQMSLQLGATPSSSASVAPYKLRLWEQWGDLPNGSVANIMLSGAAVEWTGVNRAEVDSPLPGALLMAYIDPLGRVGEVVRVEGVVKP